MLHWMRKHMKVILVGVCIIIIPSFVVWGGYAGRSRAAKNAKNAPQSTTAVASVGKIPITAGEYQQRLNAEIDRRSQRGARQSFKDLVADGSAERILDGLIDAKLIALEMSRKPFTVDRQYLVDRLKKEPAFQDEKGNFSPALWNSWVASDPKRNWNAVYADVADQVAREVLLREIMAPARVLDNDVRKEFENNFTRLQIKYVTIDPKIEPKPEQVQAEYDKDPTKYQIPEKRDVEFVVVSLTPPKPAIVDQIVERARNNEDFAALATQYSEAPDKEKGGAMDWVEQGPNDPDFLAPLFKLAVGAVSDPIDFNGTYYIYKVEQEKTSEATGARSVNARRIVITAKLDDKERAASEEKAQQIAVKAQAAKDLNAAATEAGLKVLAAKGIALDSITAENVPQSDVRAFAKDVSALDQGAVSDVIKARMALYVAKVTQVTPPVPQPLDAVREKVTQDTTESIRRSPEHLAEVQKLADDIGASVHSLSEAVAKYPDLKLEIKQTDEFSRKDFVVSKDVMMQSVEVFDAIGAKEPGAFGGPIRGFRGEHYLVELVKKVPPTDDNWKNEWPTEEPMLRRNLLAAKRNQLLTDYLADLRERTSRDTPIQRDYVTIGKILGTAEDTEEAPADQAEEPPPLQHEPLPQTPAIDLGPPASE